jgi:hypothetical protein
VVVVQEGSSQAGLRPVHLITGVLCVLLCLSPEPVAFYLLLAVILVWMEVMAIRLRFLAGVASLRQPARAS